MWCTYCMCRYTWCRMVVGEKNAWMHSRTVACSPLLLWFILSPSSKEGTTKRFVHPQPSKLWNSSASAIQSKIRNLSSEVCFGRNTDKAFLAFHLILKGKKISTHIPLNRWTCSHSYSGVSYWLHRLKCWAIFQSLSIVPDQHISSQSQKTFLTVLKGMWTILKKLGWKKNSCGTFLAQLVWGIVEKSKPTRNEEIITFVYVAFF